LTPGNIRHFDLPQTDFGFRRIEIDAESFDLVSSVDCRNHAICAVK
jgi:hypothetical protein